MVNLRPHTGQIPSASRGLHGFPAYIAFSMAVEVIFAFFGIKFQGARKARWDRGLQCFIHPAKR